MLRRHRNFKKQYKKLSLNIKDKVDKCLKIFVENKFDVSLNNHFLKGEWADHHSINITGNIRAIYKELGDTTIFVAIGTHSELYE